MLRALGHEVIVSGHDLIELGAAGRRPTWSWSRPGNIW